MLVIRLQRIGKRKKAYFRLVATEHTTKPQGKYLELLGSYDPHENKLSAKADRITYWLSKGAKLSPTANNLLVGREIIKGEKVRAWKPKVSAKAPQAEAPKQAPAAQAELTPEASTPTPEVPAEATAEAAQ